MTTEAPTPATKHPRFGRKQGIAIAIVAALVVGGVTTAAVASSQAAAAAEAHQAQAAEAAAQEAKLVVRFTAALANIQPHGQVLVDDAEALAASASPLLSAEGITALQATADAVAGALADKPKPGASSAELSALYDAQWSMILGARERMEVIITGALSGAQANLDAATVAEPAVRQTLVDAMASLTSSWASHTTTAAPFEAVNAAVVAVNESQAAVLAAQAAAAAAAEAAARSGSKPGGKRTGGYYAPNGTYVPPSGGGSTGGGTSGGGSTGEPIKSAATKAAELASLYGGSTSLSGGCLALNYGHVSGGSTFGPNATYDGYYSGVAVSRVSHPVHVNYYSVQWYACPN